ncbi:MAG TPA: hypothetical protein ENO20_14430 [Bacteroides sp.]|nr:hypothetical protein [Bacteroides sp.]
MKRAELSHPRVFDSREWAEGYYQRNKWNITRVGKDFAAMLNETERVAKPEARIMIRDLRRCLLAYVMKKFRTSHTLDEALEIIRKSDLRDGRPSIGPFWWDYMVGI